MKNVFVHDRIESIPVDRITVLNPRARNRKLHSEIVENIREVGLKRPITVSRRVDTDGAPTYDLVCGQGRLEAFQLLNQPTIPAFVTDASQEDVFVMSLVENIARRQHRAIDIMREVGSLRDRGYKDAEIAVRIGASPAWVNMITSLLDKGEERLLSAVEMGLIPIAMAIGISRSSNADVQSMLADAYERGDLRGKKLSIVRRLLEQRAKKRKGLPGAAVGGRTKHEKLSPGELRRIYEREAEKQRHLSMNARLTHDRLIFATEAMKDLIKIPAFRDLLVREELDKIPKVLSDRMNAGARR